MDVINEGYQLFPELSLVFLAYLYVVRKNELAASALAGGVLTLFIGVMLKKLNDKYLRDHVSRDVLLRPKGATDCNTTQKGLCEDDIGMPSIHSMIAGFFASKALNANEIKIFLAVSTVPFSRLSKSNSPLLNHGEYGCHIWQQIICGYAIGFVLGRYVY